MRNEKNTFNTLETATNNKPLNFKVMGITKKAVEPVTPKVRKKGLPYVGEYFGFTRPDHYEQFEPLGGNTEYEIHILMKDLSVRHLVLTFSHRESNQLITDILIQLENTAFIDDNAMGFIIYMLNRNYITNERRLVDVKSPYMRVGEKEWCKLKLQNGEYVPGTILTPDIYTVLSKYRNYKS